MSLEPKVTNGSKDISGFGFATFYLRTTQESLSRTPDPTISWISAGGWFPQVAGSHSPRMMLANPKSVMLYGTVGHFWFQRT
jgi:hypothetical protein